MFVAPVPDYPHLQFRVCETKALSPRMALSTINASIARAPSWLIGQGCGKCRKAESGRARMGADNE